MNTIIEKIRAEVLRLIRASEGPGSQYGFGMMSACNRILNFLDTLKEQPVCEGLEEAAERYEHNRVYQDELDKYANYLDSLEEGETPRMEEPSPETKYLLNADMIESFKAGAKWQREQMMKEAVEGYISATNEVSAVLALPKGDFKKGDKVKLIIVKED